MDSRVRNFFDRVTGNDLFSMPPESAKLYFAFRNSDIQARALLVTIGDGLGETTGLLVVLSALKYLHDRRNYNPLGWSETV